MIYAPVNFYKLEDCKTNICCDNQGTVNMSNGRPGRMRPGSSCDDILRNSRSLRNKIGTVIECGHVDRHMDKYLL